MKRLSNLQYIYIKFRKTCLVQNMIDYFAYKERIYIYKTYVGEGRVGGRIRTVFVLLK